MTSKVLTFPFRHGLAALLIPAVIALAGCTEDAERANDPRSPDASPPGGGEDDFGADAGDRDRGDNGEDDGEGTGGRDGRGDGDGDGDGDSAPEHVDDTFRACLDQEGPRVTIDPIDHGYTGFRASSPADSSVFDARGASWRYQTYPTIRRETTTAINLSNRSGDEACLMGGKVVGTNEPPVGTPSRDGGGSWRDYKRERGWAVRLAQARPTVDGFRADNMGEDGISVSRASGWTVRNSWVSRIADDGIDMRPNVMRDGGLIQDVLLDRVFYPIALDGGSSATCGDFTDRMLTLDGVLARHLPMPNGSGGTTTVYTFKTNACQEMGISIKNSVLAFDRGRGRSSPDGRFRRALEWVRDHGTCSNNVIAWKSDEPFPPRDFPIDQIDELNDAFPGCFTILTGQQARDFWHAARENWIHCHPEVDRVLGDPESDYARCDPTFYGGGGTNLSPSQTP